MKTKELEEIGESVDIKFNENGFCVITLTDLKNFANKICDQEKQALKEELRNRIDKVIFLEPHQKELLKSML